VARRYPPEFRRKVLDLPKAGRTVAQLINDLQISDQTIYNWRRQELVDSGSCRASRLPTWPSWLRLVAVSRSWRPELEAHRRAAELLKEVVPPKDRYAVIKTMARRACRLRRAAGSCMCPGTTPGSGGVVAVTPVRR
jgi:transposase-like protein